MPEKNSSTFNLSSFIEKKYSCNDNLFRRGIFNKFLVAWRPIQWTFKETEKQQIRFKFKPLSFCLVYIKQSTGQ
jgi:hypothetical protein